VIPVAEIRALQVEWQLREDVIEKDYALGWLLIAIANDPDLKDKWIFKGGTALRKCYFETYRFSEDLDFSLTADAPDAPEQLVPIFSRISAVLMDRCGLELSVDANSFKRRRNRRGNPTTEGKLAYRGPRQPPSAPKVKLDLTRDEILAAPPVARPIAHPYSDAPVPPVAVACYSLEELMAEKMRALAERCRPRDLYDVVNMHRHPDLVGRASEVSRLLSMKCAFAGIAVPTLETIQVSPLASEVKTEWSSMLAHQLPHLPAFSTFWRELASIFQWLIAEVQAEVLPRLPVRPDEDGTWIAPRAMTSWRTWRAAFPLELVRFAGANRLKVELNYQAKQGRSGPRLVEPYSLRRRRNGVLLLYVVNDRGQLRSHDVSRIAGARITDQTFVPRYFVEF
jgi:predicted nucleotidyltransferase component of viral defense system